MARQGETSIHGAEDARLGWILRPPLKAGIKGTKILNPAAMCRLTGTINEHDAPVRPSLLLQ
jgi:hypothetical protein